MDPITLGLIGAGTSALVQGYSAYKNYNLQSNQLAWQKAQWEEVKQREDNATQRKVADLRAAGLSPTLAAGGASPTSPAPILASPQVETSKIDPVKDYLNLVTMQENIAQSKMQQQLTMQQVIKTLADTDNAKAQAYKNLQEGNIKAHDYQIFRKTGMPSNSSEYGKLFREILSAYDTHGGKVPVPSGKPLGPKQGQTIEEEAIQQHKAVPYQNFNKKGPIQPKSNTTHIKWR